MCLSVCLSVCVTKKLLLGHANLISNIEKNLNVTNCAYPLKKGGELIDFCIKSIKYSAIYKYTYIKDLIVLVAIGFLTKSL